MDNLKITLQNVFSTLLCLFLISFFSTTYAQQKALTGTVTDQNGQQLPGVTVIVKGTTIGTVTNTEGEFSLSVPPDAQTLQFPLLGCALRM